MQHVYNVMFRDISYAQALAVREDTLCCLFLRFFSNSLTCKEFASSINDKYFFKQCQTGEDLLKREERKPPYYSISSQVATD